jgi:hypothetical protein
MLFDKEINVWFMYQREPDGNAIAVRTVPGLD